MTTPVELAQLIGELVDDQLTAAGRERLTDLLRSDASARAYYLDYMELHSRLLGTPDRSIFEVSHPSSFIPHPSSIPPIIVDASPSLHSAFGSFVFSHVAAAVILGIGLLIGLAWRISLPSSERPTPDNNIAQVVGRITALADCAWSKQRSEVRGQGSGLSEIQIPKSRNPQIPVFLGDRFLVASGLMQITYDTGAKVLLQGPCTYEIDADNGGYLAVGKLTAKVEKGLGGRGPGSGNANHSPLSPLPSPLFAVRTPTAVVTDLGTEFGVEVEKSGTTRSHVFQGSVEFRVANSQSFTNSNLPVEVLHAGESARVERGRNRNVVVVHESGQPVRFVRQMPARKAVTKLSLADIMAGGDGTGWHQQVFYLTDSKKKSASPPRAESGGEWMPEASQDGPIDGTLSWTGVPGAVQLDSVGHKFTGFPIANGMTASVVRTVVAIRDTKYWPGYEGAIGLSSSTGIAFDLEAIRRDNPKKPRSLLFQASVAMAHPDGESDVWVFVDGIPRYRRLGIVQPEGVYPVTYPVSVPLGSKARHLTLVAAGRSRDVKSNKVAWLDPTLCFLEDNNEEGSGARD